MGEPNQVGLQGRCMWGRVEVMCGFLEEILAGEVIGLGEGRKDGSSRSKMVQEFNSLTCLTASVLDKSMNSSHFQGCSRLLVRVKACWFCVQACLYHR